MSTPLLVRTADRPGALERLLGLVRRKAMKLRPEGFGRQGPGDTWAVVLAPTAPDVPLHRYVHDIRALVDVEDVQVLPPEALGALVRIGRNVAPFHVGTADDETPEGGIS